MSETSDEQDDTREDETEQEAGRRIDEERNERAGREINEATRKDTEALAEVIARDLASAPDTEVDLDDAMTATGKSATWCRAALSVLVKAGRAEERDGFWRTAIDG